MRSCRPRTIVMMTFLPMKVYMYSLITGIVQFDFVRCIHQEGNASGQSSLKQHGTSSSNDEVSQSARESQNSSLSPRSREKVEYQLLEEHARALHGGSSPMAGSQKSGSLKCHQTLRGHTELLRAVAVVRDRIVSAGNDNAIKVWDVATGNCIHTFEEAHAHWISALADVGHDRVASSSFDGTIKVAYEDRGSFLIVMCLVVQVWNLANTGELALSQTLVGHMGVVYAVAACSDHLVSGGADKTVKLWDTNKGSCFRTCLGHTGVVAVVIQFGAGKWVASGSWDCTVRVSRAPPPFCIVH